MIIFDLACSCGFQFEGWFQDHQDYESQRRSGLLACPECGASSVRKILSPVAVRTGSVDAVRGHAGERRLTSEALRLLGAMQGGVERNFKDVGHGLAQEALKMHYGVTELRNIRGVATQVEEDLLHREGIELLKFPMLPKDKPPVN